MNDDRTKPATGRRLDGASATANVPRREITSGELFAGRREIHIRHADEVYTLRQTSKGKLILTK